MFKYIAAFFTFLLPIVRKAVVQVAADELTRAAYPERSRRPRFDYYGGARPRTMEEVDALEAERIARVRAYSKKDAAETQTLFAENGDGVYQDVITVAFDISGKSAKDVQTWLQDQMPTLGDHGDAGEINLDSWWVAEDERYDNSDCDSAVFVTKGNQKAARIKLRQYGLAD